MLIVLMSLMLQGPTAPPLPPEKYRLDVNTSNELDQTAIGKPKLTGSLVTTAFVEISMVDTLGGQIAVIHVDSMSLNATGQMLVELQRRPNAEADARGASVRIPVVAGRIAGLPRYSDSTNSALGPIAQAAGVLFPTVRRNVKVGQTWADTTHINRAQGAQKATGEVIVNWTVTGVRPGGGVIIDGVTTGHTRTEDSGSGQAMTMASHSTQHFVLSANGPVWQALVETTGDMSVTAPQIPGAIPGRNTGTMKVTRLP
ncbi:MAG TPA: hypothetical protein VGM77_04905 [Gemmatimonadales bacterium]|jgi:hypothetical protein